uniref:Capping protein regulator and myosin 1 linker 2 n=1 Tax=Neolamprologus brichardi TaxID=32507 RepID=A0A3Q4H458_NEOBR
RVNYNIVLETDRQTLYFSVLHTEDLEAMISHMTASLKRIFPDSSPGKLLKTIPPDLKDRLLTLIGAIEEQMNSQPGYCGGFSDTYAALCDFNEMPFREEIQWDVDNIYYIHNWRQFNLQDFSHLDSRDLALAVAALSFNQWFTKIYCKDLKLSVDIQQQLTYLLSRSPSLEELSLEASGLKLDFAVKMAAALKEHASSSLQSINLSGNPIEDKGVIALSQNLENLEKGLKRLSLSRVSMTARGLGCLSQVLSSSQRFSTSLTHLDLSGNTSSLVTEEATFLFKFLSSTNSLSYLDLSDTSCPLDTVKISFFLSLSLCACTCVHVYRKVQEVTRSIQEFFSQSCELKYVGLSATKLPPQALRLLLQGLATNKRLFGLELDLSSCELRSAGAQVIQEHISEATAIRSLDISDNSFENDMVTLVLSVGRCQSLRHLALGRNFAMKSRALTDVLQRIAQLIQDEECPLQSLSVSDSKLKTGMHILLSALGGHAALVELDISGNFIGDTGAKMLSKALMSNTSLRTLTWDRNSVTARGFQDVADALERNFTLQHMSLPLADITPSYRSNPDRTKEALHKVSVFSRLLFKIVCVLCLESSLQRLSHCCIQEDQADVLKAHEVLQHARDSLKVHASKSSLVLREDCLMLFCLQMPSLVLTEVLVSVFQELSQGLMRHADALYPRVVQRSSVCECLSECVSKRRTQTHIFIRSTLVESTGHIINNRLSVYDISNTLYCTVCKYLWYMQSWGQLFSCIIQDLVESDFPTDDYSPAIWRNSFYSKSLRPACSIKSLLDADWEQQIRDRGAEREWGGGAGEKDGGGRCGLPWLPTATSLSLTASSPTLSPSTSPSPSPPGQRGSRRREGEVVAADAAEAAAGCGGLHRREAPFPGCCLSPGPFPRSGYTVSPMEPLPTQGQTLRHYTASRPRPRRTHTQPPSSRPQEAVSKVENEASEEMGRVDEGVEEFFTKKIIPDYALSTPSVSTPLSSTSDIITSSTTTLTSPYASTDMSFTSTDVPPLSTSIPSTFSSVTTTTTLPTKNIKKKFGDFFAFKRARVARATKASGGEGGGGEGVKVKRTSIADLIRPLREAKERERERERDKEREKERGARSVEDANISNDATTTEGISATSQHLAGDVREKRSPAQTLTMMMPPSETTPLYPTITTSPDLTTTVLSNLEEEAAPVLPARMPSPVVTRTLTEQDKQLVGTPYGERRLKVTKRALREGKSQSLILLTGLETDDKDTPTKKHASESTSSFEQKLQVMLHRMGVAKTPPAETKMSQNKDEELRKANSDGAILDKPEPPPTYMKPRTMSTSSADPRHPIRSLHPVRPDPLLPPKPTLPERPIGPLPPKPAISARPPLSTLAAAGGARPSSAPPSSSPVELLEGGKHDGREISSGIQSLPKPRQHMKPPPQRRAVSVHEDAFAMTQGEALHQLPPQTRTLEKSPVMPPPKNSTSTAPALPQTLDKLLVSPAPREKTLSTIPVTSGYSDVPQVSPTSNKKKVPSPHPQTDLPKQKTHLGGRGLRHHCDLELRAYLRVV